MYKSFLTVLFFISFIPASIAEVKYNFHDIKQIFGSSSSVRDINNSNQALIADDNTLGLQFWDGKTTSNIHSDVLPHKMNDSGHFAGITNLDFGNGIYHAGYWNGSDSFDLGAFGPLTSSGWDINNLGQLTGVSNTVRGPNQSHATLWDPGANSMIDLGTLKGGWNSIAFAINDKTQIVGFSETKFNTGGIKEEHATLWQGNKIIDLGRYNGVNDSRALDINNNNQVIGYSNNHGVAPDHQIIWDISDFNDIKIHLIDNAQTTNAINDRGDVVGTSKDGYAFIWNDGAMTDLNTLINPQITSAGWHLTGAFDINNNGWITGNAVNSLTGENTNFLIEPNHIPPIPEPSTYLMMLVGAGIMGLFAKRKISVA